MSIAAYIAEIQKNFIEFLVAKKITKSFILIFLIFLLI